MQDYKFNVTRRVNVVNDEFISVPATSEAQAEAALKMLMDHYNFEYSHSWSITEEYDEDLRDIELAEEEDNNSDTLHEFCYDLDYAGLTEQMILKLLSKFPPPDSFFRFLTEEQKAEAFALLNGDHKGEDAAEFQKLVYASEEGESKADEPPPTAEELASEARYQAFKEKLGKHYKGPYPYIVAQNMSLPIEELQAFVKRYEREEGVSIG